MEIKELSLTDLLFTLMTMLIGKEGVDFSYYEFDDKWWEMRLYLRIN